MSIFVIRDKFSAMYGKRRKERCGISRDIQRVYIKVSSEEPSASRVPRVVYALHFPLMLLTSSYRQQVSLVLRISFDWLSLGSLVNFDDEQQC
jgi:hypothetical protein